MPNPGQRKAQFKQEMKLRILQAALRIAEKMGWDNVSVRKITEKVNYSTIKVYQEFGSKNGLLLELLRSGYAELAAALRTAIAGEDDVREKIRLASLAVRDFTEEKPHYFQLMMGAEGAPAIEREGTENEVRAFLEHFREDLFPGRAPSLLYHWWALVCGLILTGRRGHPAEDRAGLFEECIGRFLSSIE